MVSRPEIQRASFLFARCKMGLFLVISESWEIQLGLIGRGILEWQIVGNNWVRR